MKHKLNFATWWRYITGRKVVENAIFNTLTTKMPPYLDIFNILGVVRYRSFELTVKMTKTKFRL